MQGDLWTGKLQVSTINANSLHGTITIQTLFGNGTFQICIARDNYHSVLSPVYTNTLQTAYKPAVYLKSVQNRFKIPVV